MSKTNVPCRDSISSSWAIRTEEIASLPIAASQESTDLSAMPRIGLNRAGNTGG